MNRNERVGVCIVLTGGRGRPTKSHALMASMRVTRSSNVDDCVGYAPKAAIRAFRAATNLSHNPWIGSDGRRRTCELNLGGVDAPDKQRDACETNSVHGLGSGSR